MLFTHVKFAKLPRLNVYITAYKHWSKLYVRRVLSLRKTQIHKEGKRNELKFDTQIVINVFCH